MPLERPIHPGKVAWTGENPGILLKRDPDGPLSAVALYFRIFWSPVGRGTVLMLMEQPNEAKSLPSVHNIILSDNHSLADFLRTTFIAKLPAFAEAPAFSALKHVDIVESYATGNPASRYGEVVKAKDLEIVLDWDELGTPTALELPAHLTGGKVQEAYNVLVESRKPTISINGRALEGDVFPREQAGIKTTSAFLYFSETWIEPAS